MRHRVATKRLNRDMDHRKALLRSLTEQLIQHEKIETTLAKAKYLRGYVERLITKAKKARTGDKITKFNTVKEIKKVLISEEIIKKLVDDIATRFEKRPGGYIRIVKTGNRDGDNAEMSRIELVKETKEVKEPKASKEKKQDE